MKAVPDLRTKRAWQIQTATIFMLLLVGLAAKNLEALCATGNETSNSNNETSASATMAKEKSAPKNTNACIEKSNTEKSTEAKVSTGDSINFGSSSWGITSTSAPAKPRVKAKEKWTPINPRSNNSSLGVGGSTGTVDDESGRLARYYHSPVPVDFLFTAKFGPTDDKKGLDLEKSGVKFALDGKYAEAFTAFEEASTMLPARAILFYNMGVVKEHLSKWPEARKDFEKAYALDPQNPHNLLEIARCYAVEGRSSRAILTLNKKEWSSTEFRRVSGMGGVSIMTGSEVASSREYYLSSASDQDLVIGAMNALTMDNVLSAQRLRQELEHRQPFAFETYLIKGSLQLEEGKYKEALASLKEADKLYPGDPNVLMGLVRSYMELGLLGDMTATQKRFASLYPNDPRAEAGKLEQRDLLSYQTNTILDRKTFNSMPINVYIRDFDDATRSWPRKPDKYIDYISIVQQCCSEWENASYHKVQFVIVTNTRQDQQFDVSKPTIFVDFVPDYVESIQGHSDAAGLTRTIPNGRGGYYCSVSLMVGTSGDKNSAQTFYETATHEFGHALGLSHSPDPADIMFYTLHGVSARSLTTRDKQRISNVYR